MASTENNNTYTRSLDIEVLAKELIIYQKLEGDVNCVVWDAAIVLAKYLEELYKKNCQFLQGLDVIELGAGLGPVGLVAASLGANVLLTDLFDAIPLLQFNINENKALCKGEIRSAVLKWGDKIDFGYIPDKILLADCIYYKESIDSLIDTLRYYATEKTEIILAQELRESDVQKNNWDYFLENVKNYFRCVVVPISEQNPDYCSPDIVLLKLFKI
ncbi:Lysine methyltransferase [Popillia japonica]|uniref:Lysine methyltransferase n=1 Tax=Popillia japonica TaxID=7064 RepID=A0AAW1KP07_POPJA